MPPSLTHAPLAIVGAAGRFPGAPDLAAFRSLLFGGRSAVGELPASRFDPDVYYDPRPGTPGRSDCRIGGVVPDTPFDAAGLGWPAATALGVDRAPLWALEVARDTLRSAGFGADDLRGSNTAVVLGHARGSRRAAESDFAASLDDLLRALDDVPALRALPRTEREAVRRRAAERLRARVPDEDPHAGPGEVASALAGLVSATFGLTGRHLIVDAVCASSLAALDLGGRALRLGTADLALVGGVSYSQDTSVVAFAQARAVSRRGVFPFDARADGFVSADGSAWSCSSASRTRSPTAAASWG